MLGSVSNTSAYYALLKRAGKLIRKTSKTTKLEVAKRKLRDFLEGILSVRELPNNARKR